MSESLIERLRRLVSWLRPEYRVVKDSYAGYEVQYRRWWFPIWIQVGVNTWSTLDRAEQFARQVAHPEVKPLGRL